MGAADIADRALEGTIVLSFSKIGYLARQRLFHWSDLAECRISDRVVVVTGATSGLGAAASLRLARLGASVVLVGRDPVKTATARDRIVAATGNESTSFALADLSDFDSVRALATRVADANDRVDALVHNAGALLSSFTRSAQGIETTVAAQVLGPFLLTAELLPLLRRTHGSRVVTVSSGGMYSERLDVDRLEMQPAEYDGTTAYARAKRAQVVLNEQWAARSTTRWPVFHAMHPGWSDTPGVRTSLPTFARIMGPLLRSPDQGADTAVWLAAADEPRETSGRFWLDRRPRGTTYLPRTRAAAGEAGRLWDYCIQRSGPVRI